MKKVYGSLNPPSRASAVALSLLLGLGVSTWMFFQERAAKQEQVRLLREAETARRGETEQRRQAQADKRNALNEAEKSKQVAKFLKDMLLAVRPSVALGRDTTLLREILDNAALRVGNDLTNKPEVAIELLGALGITYDSLGLYQKEEEMASRSLEIARSRFGSESAATSEGLYQIGLALRRLGNLNEAERAARESVRIRRRLIESERSKLSTTADLKSTNESLHLADQAGLGDLYASLNVLALILHAQSKLAEAETNYSEALEIARKIRGNEHSDVATFLSGLAAC